MLYIGQYLVTDLCLRSWDLIFCNFSIRNRFRNDKEQKYSQKLLITSIANTSVLLHFSVSKFWWSKSFDFTWSSSLTFQIPPGPCNIIEEQIFGSGAFLIPNFWILSVGKTFWIRRERLAYNHHRQLIIPIMAPDLKIFLLTGIWEIWSQKVSGSKRLLLNNIANFRGFGVSKFFCFYLMTFIEFQSHLFISRDINSRYPQ